MTRLFAALLSLTALSACASGGGGPGALGGDGSATLKPGERIALADRSQLRYIGVTADSRCPPNVQCIRAGDADVAFEFAPVDGVAQPLAFNTDTGRSLRAGNWTIELTALAHGDAPAATVRVAATP